MPASLYPQDMTSKTKPAELYASLPLADRRCCIDMHLFVLCELQRCAYSWTSMLIDGACRAHHMKKIVCCRGASSHTLPSAPYISVQKEPPNPEHQPSREITQHKETMWVPCTPQSAQNGIARWCFLQHQSVITE
jgi:hypothetical protein